MGACGDFRPVAAVDEGKGQMQQQIDDAGRTIRFAEQAVEQFADLGADARQGAGAGKKGIEKRGPHDKSIASRDKARKRARPHSAWS